MYTQRHEHRPPVDDECMLRETKNESLKIAVLLPKNLVKVSFRSYLRDVRLQSKEQGIGELFSL